MKAKQLDKNQAIPFWVKYMPIMLFVTAFLLYANGIGNGYNMDDELVTRNHRFTSKGIAGIPEIFSNPYYSDDMGYAYEYRPIVLTSFAIEHQFFGDKPGVSHFFNVLLYALSVLILFLLLKKTFQAYSYWISVFAVLLFLFHPLHTEAVDSIKNRDEILSLLGGLLTWWFSIKFVEKSKWYYLPIIAASFLFGALAKMSLMPMVLLIPISLFLFHNASGKKVLIISFLLVGLSFLFSPLRNPLEYIPIYIGAAIVPFILELFYSKKLTFSVIKSESRRILTEINNKPQQPIQAVFKLDNSLINFKELKYNTFVIQSILFVFAAIISFLYNNGFIASFTFIYFGYLFYTTTVTQKNVLTFLFVLFYSSFCVYHYTPQYVDFLSVFLFYLFVFDRQFRNYIQVVSIAILLIIGVYNQDFNIFTYPLLFLITWFSDKNKVVFWINRLFILILLVFTAVVIFTLVLKPEDIFTDLFLILSNICLLLVLIIKARKYLLPFLLFILFPVLVHIYISPTLESSLVKTQSVMAKETGANVAEGFIQGTIYTTERPISFAEMPVSNNSPMGVRIGSAVDVLGFYMQKVCLPYPMGYYYGYAYFTPKDLSDFSLILLLIIHLALGLLSLIYLKKYPIVCFGVLFYLFSIVLYSGFLYPIVGVAADRFTYIASIGFCIALAAGLYFLFHKHVHIPANKLPSKVLLAIVSVILVGYGIITINRNEDWNGALSLMSNDIEHLDESAQAHNLYALNLMRESFENKKLPENKKFEMRKLAVIHFDKAIEIWPDFFNAAFDKGRSSITIGDYASAIDGFEKAIEIGPTAGFLEPYKQLGDLYLQQGRVQDFFRTAKKLYQKEKAAESYSMLARAYFLKGEKDSTKFYLHKGIQAFPNEVNLRKNLAEVFKTEGQQDSVLYYSRN